jgi:hypothetical protein
LLLRGAPFAGLPTCKMTNIRHLDKGSSVLTQFALGGEAKGGMHGIFRLVQVFTNKELALDLRYLLRSCIFLASSLLHGLYDRDSQKQWRNQLWHLNGYTQSTAKA